MFRQWLYRIYSMKSVTAVATVCFIASAPVFAQIYTDFSGGDGSDLPFQFPGTGGDGWGGAWQPFGDITEQEVRTDNPFGGQSHYLYTDVTDASTVGFHRSYAEEATNRIDRSEPHIIHIQWRLENVTNDWSHGRHDRLQIHSSTAILDNTARADRRNAWTIEFGAYNYGRDEFHRGEWRLKNGDGSGGADMISVPVEIISGAIGTVYDLRIELFPDRNRYDVVISDGANTVRASRDLNNGELLGFRGDYTAGVPENITFVNGVRGGSSGPFEYSLNNISILPAGRTVLIEKNLPRAAIILADNVEFSVRYAATMLNRYLKKCTGAELPVLYASEVESLDPDRHWVLLGQSDFTRALGIEVDKPYGGFKIVSRPGRVYLQDGASVEEGGILAIVGQDYPRIVGAEDEARESVTNEGIIRNSDRPDLGWTVQRLNLDGDYVRHEYNSGGTLYGVVRFLRDQMGIRWLWPGEVGTVVPEHDAVVVGKYDVEDEPALMVRWIRNRYRYTLRTGYETDEWWRANFQGLGRRFHGNHAFGSWKDRFFEDHPEYFGWQPKGETHAQPRIADHHWKLCPSEPGVVDQIVKDARNRFDNDPHAWTVSVSQGDVHSTGNCMCDDCLEFDRQLQEEYDDIPTRSYTDAKTGESFEHIIETDRHIAWWNRIAERLEETHPGRYVASWAYGPYSHPPVRERARDNVIVGYVGFCWISDGYKRAREQWEAWAEKAPNMYLRPNVPFGSFSFPHNYTRPMVEDIRHCYETGMIGAEFSSLMGHWATQGLIYYVLAHSMWNPQLDVDELINDYCESGFGPGAPYIRAYFDLLEQKTAEFRRARATAAERGAAFPAGDYVEVLEEELEPGDERDHQLPGRDEGREVEGPIDLEAAPNWIARRVRPREVHRLNAEVLMRYYDRLAGKLVRARARVAGKDPAFKQRISFLEKGLHYAYLESALLLNWYELPRHKIFEKIDRRNAFLEEVENSYVVNALYLRNRYTRYGMHKDFFDHETPYRTDDRWKD